MLSDAGQAETSAGICKMLMVIPSSPFFAKPNVSSIPFSVVVQNKSK